MQTISELNLTQVKSLIISIQHQIKSLSNELEGLIEQETKLIAEQNNCEEFLPPVSEFNRQHRCVRCGQWERAHKAKAN
jgi:hypothetical protein